MYRVSQKLGVFGRLVDSSLMAYLLRRIFLPLFRPRGLERNSSLDKVIAFSGLTCV